MRIRAGVRMDVRWFSRALWTEIALIPRVLDFVCFLAAGGTPPLRRRVQLEGPA